MLSLRLALVISAAAASALFVPTWIVVQFAIAALQVDLVSRNPLVLVPVGLGTLAILQRVSFSLALVAFPELEEVPGVGRVSMGTVTSVATVAAAGAFLLAPPISRIEDLGALMALVAAGGGVGAGVGSMLLARPSSRDEASPGNRV